jgi:hypothetical protein
MGDGGFSTLTGGSGVGGMGGDGGTVESRSSGKGGRKSGMWDGGRQPKVLGRLRVGEDGFDIGDKGKGGVDGRRCISSSCIRSIGICLLGKGRSTTMLSRVPSSYTSIASS